MRQCVPIEKRHSSHTSSTRHANGAIRRPRIPCAGVKGFTERGRDVYVEDDTYRAVWDAADWPTRDAMDLAYLTGQRPADVLKMQITDIRDAVRQA